MVREAERLERLGSLSAAADLYERVLARCPDLPDCWYNLGLARRGLRRFEPALAAYQQALERGVTRPEEVHLNRAVIFADCLRRAADAERELRAALALNPRYVPALQNLANLHEDLGRRDEARSTYESILELAPASFESLARYAGLAHLSGAGDPLIERLRRALADPAAGPAARASLGFALARALDSCAAYAAAFAAAEAANRDSRASAPGVVGYDRQAQERSVDALIQAFREREPGAAAGAGTDGPRPIFICGMFRSGSTLAEQLLGAHPLVATGGELDLLPHLVQTRLAPFPQALTRVSQAALVALAADYRNGIAQLFAGTPYVTDKRPDNFVYIGLIKRLFPDALIVHTTRDPLDTCLSIFLLHLEQRMSYALDLLDIGHYFKEYRRLMAHWQQLYPGEVLEFNYDSLVSDPRPVVEHLLAYCSLGWDEACLTPGPRGAVRTASVWQVREPLYRRSSGRSRHYQRELAPLAAYLSQP